MRARDVLRGIVVSLTVFHSTANADVIYPANPDFTHYANNNYIISHAFQGDSILWVGGGYGAVRWNLNTSEYREFTTKDGLASNAILEIAIDLDGNIWFAAGENGLSKFDGTNWTNIKTPILNSDSVATLAIDSTGQVWVGTAKGINWFDGTDWWAAEELAPDNVVSTAGISAIVVDSSNNVWIGTAENGLVRYDGDQWNEFYTEDLLSTIAIDLAIDKSGAVWLATFNSIFKYDLNSWTSYSGNDSLSFNFYYGLESDPDGNIITFNFVAIDFGNNVFTTEVEYFDGNNWSPFMLPEGGPELGMGVADAVTISYDSEGNLWYSNGNEGIRKYDGTGWKDYRTVASLAHNSVIAMAADSSGNVWFGTPRGASRFDGENWQSFQVSPEGQMIVTTIAVAPDGTLWFGGVSPAFVSSFDGSTWNFYTADNGLFNDRVGINDIAVDPRGYVWVGTDIVGVDMFDGSNWTNYNSASSGIGGSEINSIAVDRDSTIWVGTDMGVSHYDGGDWINLSADDLKLGVPSGSRSREDSLVMVSIPANESGNPKYFLGITEGSLHLTALISREQGDTAKTYTTVDLFGEYFQLAGDTTVGLFSADREGNILVGIKGVGVSRFDGTTSQIFNTANGLFSNNITTALDDPEGKIWFGSVDGGGVSFLNVEDIHVIRGDLDGNENVNIFDLLSLLKVIGGKETDQALIGRADVDGNGKTDIFDLLELLRLL